MVTAKRAYETHMTQFDSIKESLKADLPIKICVVIFDRVDGEERKMTCTLMPKYLPNGMMPEDVHGSHSDQQPVWDIEANDWRSFLWPNVKQYWTKSEPTS